MFGMLDYRAHKFYLMLFGIPWLVLRWIAIIGLPFAWYAIGLDFAQNRIAQILISLLAAFVGEILWAILITLIGKLFMFLFGLIVDVIPVDGRTKEEAVSVVQGGEKSIFALILQKKHPSEWSDEDIAYSSKGFFNFFFQDQISNRFSEVREHYRLNPELTLAYDLDKFLVEKNLQMGWPEKILTNATYRGMFISYTLMLYLLLFNPFKG